MHLISGRVVRVLSLGCALITTGALRAQAPEPPILRGRIELTIGGANAADDATFGRISGLAVDATGRVFVADWQDLRIHVFSPTGQALSKIGRPGSGPMEFRQLATIGFGPDRLLWARDEGNARMQAIEVAAKAPRFVKQVPLQQFTGGSRLPLTFGVRGEMFDESIWFDTQQKTFRPLRVRRGADGSVQRVDTLPIPPHAFSGTHKVISPQRDAAGKVIGMAERFYHQPFGPQWLRAYGPGGVRAEVVTAGYDVRVYGPDGRLLRSLTRRVPAVAPSARERRHGDSVLAEAKAPLPFGVPRAKAPIVGLVWTQDGQLWVERAVADGRPREADVYDRQGARVATTQWQSTLDLLGGFPVIIDNTVVAVTSDADGIERVVRVRFR